MLYGSRVNPADKNDPLSMIASLVRERCRVLDVGSGVGNLAAFLSETKGCFVTAVEASPTMARMAAEHCHKVLAGDIEHGGLRREVIEAGPYDYIIFADVLEHLADPWAVLTALRAALAPRGRVLISLPNVAHWSVRLRLLSGSFEYTDGFLLDRSHLRFFTMESGRQLVRQCGYRIDKEMVRWAPLPGDRVWRMIPFLRDWVNDSLARSSPGLFGYQFVYSIAEKNR